MEEGQHTLRLVSSYAANQTDGYPATFVLGKG